MLILYKFNFLISYYQSAEEKQPKKVKKEKKENKTFELTIKEWLKKNSLTALKLRIIDALGPVVVKQNASHVQILDKYVTSKVWNDVRFKI